MITSIIFNIINTLELCLRPLITIFALVLSYFVSPIKKRINFEKLNLTFKSGISFKVTNQVAHLCFEVSSEGELEQVRPLIEEALHSKKQIEIIYSSPSVEKKIQSLYDNYPKLIRALRMPLLTAGPGRSQVFQSVSSWITAPKLIFCRYDFFPELLRLKSRMEFILISGATKNLGWYKLETFKLFDIIVAATDIETKIFKELLGENKKYFSCDLRIPRIHQRTTKYVDTLRGHSYLEKFLNHLDTIEMKDKIILGSAWPSDLSILENQELIHKVKNKELTIVVAPHKLDDQSIAELNNKLVTLFGESSVSVLSKDKNAEFNQVTILRVSGILCELYNKFGVSYVGGGYERSIHSVFEPFFSNNIVITGGNVKRSTEYDYINANLPGEIHVLKNPESFYTILSSLDIDRRNLDLRQTLIKQSYAVMDQVKSAII